MPLIALAIAAGAPAQQPKSLYDQVVMRPDPSNGFDDYIRAADAINDGYARVYMTWRPGDYDRLLKLAGNSTDAATTERLRLAKELDEGGYLGVQAAMAKRYGRALDLLRQGNQKRVWDPRSLGYRTPLPEVPVLYALVALCCSAAYTDYAKGDPKAGTRDLLDGLSFASNLEPNSMIDLEKGMAWEPILMNRFAGSLGNISEADSRQVVAFVDDQMQRPLAYASALKRQRDLVVSSINDIVTPGLKHREYETPSEAFTWTMTAEQRNQAAAAIVDGVNRRYSDIMQMLDGPESTWNSMRMEVPDPDDPVSDVDTFVRRYVEGFGVPGSMSLIQRERTSMRLLGLNARIINFRWHNNRLPNTLAEAVPKDRIRDPISDQDFVYEPNPDGTYRLYSKGNAATGIIELRYRPSGSGGNDQVPPPGISAQARG
ncbi:MAG TPA: hypothetical protein VHE55_18270 [Fimbriimonadaceae bacterium]|nr:hypothetical protein [Fimbriimonadaceae bacterium]